MKKRTKKQVLEDLFINARTNLPDRTFMDWLAYCYGIFESTVRFNRRISQYDITLIAMDLKRMKTALSKIPKCKAKGCKNRALYGLNYCAHHNLEHRVFGTVNHG